MSDLEIKKKYGLFDNQFNKNLLSSLARGGEDVLVFPPLQTIRRDLNEADEARLKNLSGFDWLILTDVFAADYFIEYLNELAVDFYELDDLTICAAGEAVADRLRFVQVHADVIPSKLSDDHVFAAISNYAGADLSDLKILVVREQDTKFAFVEKLARASAAPEELSVYRAVFPDPAAAARLKTLLAGGAVDEFVFTAPEDLLGLKFLLSGADLNAILEETRISAATEVVYQSLQENGFRPLYFHYK